MESHQLLQTITTDVIQVETSLLGYLASGYARYEEVVEIVDKVSEVEFYSEKNRQIYQAIKATVEDKLSPNVSGLSYYTQKLGLNLKDSDLNMLVVSSDIVAVGQAYRAIETIHNASVRRKLIKYFNEVQRQALTTPDTSKLLADVEVGVLDLEMKRKTNDDIQSIGSEARQIAQDNSVKKSLGTSTGYKQLDALVGGFIPSHTWVIGGYSGTGKTFFTLQLVLNVLRQGKSVVFFSLEMSKHELYYRLASLITGKTSLKMQAGHHLKELEDAIKNLDQYKDRLFIYDDVYTSEEIRLKCRKHKLLHNTDLVVVDFIQNIQGEREQMFEMLTRVSVEFQKLAKSLGVTMVALSQISNESAMGSGEVLTYKGSGAIAQVCDVGIMLMKSKDKPNDIECQVKKARHGIPNRKVDLLFDFNKGGRFIEYEQKA